MLFKAISLSCTSVKVSTEGKNCYIVVPAIQPDPCQLYDYVLYKVQGILFEQRTNKAIPNAILQLDTNISLSRYVMCILFIKFLKAAKASEFKLILASNRDEFFKRPARTAHFWEEDCNIFGGRDMTEGKEGGTWLAMSKKGKLGVLLNVCGDNGNPEKRGRGFLITDYLKNSLSNKDYLERIKETAHEYNKFHLLTASLGKNPNLLYFSNGKECDVTEIQSEIFAISNSSVENPFQKVKKGKSRFEEICNKFGCTDKKEELIKELLSFLKWDQRHYPDDVIDSISTFPVSNKSFLSSVFVKAPEIYYGTRTHTIILIDWKDNVEFHEWSLEEPITPEHMQWHETHKNFQIKTN